MKRYIHIALIALVAQVGLSNVVYAMNIDINDTENDIVNNIKRHSNLTEADVKQYKSLQFGGLVTYGAFLLGAASSIGVGKTTYQYAGAIKASVPEFLKSERIPSWMTTPLPLASLGFVGTGLLGYQFVKQPVDEEVKNNIVKKVQKYIDKCAEIAKDNQKYPQDQDTIYNIFNYSFQGARQSPKDALKLLRAYLPASWPHDDDNAVYKALFNLQEQGRRAKTLLNYIGLGDEVDQKIREVNQYYNTNLFENVELYKSMITQAKRQEIEQAEQQETKNVELEYKKAQTNVAQQTASFVQAKKIQTYGEMFSDSIRNVTAAINAAYKNRHKIGSRLAVFSILGYGAYNYAQNWLTGIQ